MGTVGGVCEGGDAEADRPVRERLRDRDRHVVAVNITSRIKKVPPCGEICPEQAGRMALEAATASSSKLFMLS